MCFYNETSVFKLLQRILDGALMVELSLSLPSRIFSTGVTHKDQRFTASSTQASDPPTSTVPQALAVEVEEEEAHIPLLSELLTEISTNPSDSEARAEGISQEEEVE